MQYSYVTRRLALADSFGISREKSIEKFNTFVKIEDGEGEAAPSSFYGETPQTVEAALAQMLGLIDSDPVAVERSLDSIEQVIRDNRAAKAAVDMALHDRLGKTLGKPLYELWGLDPQRTPVSSFTIGLADTEEMLNKITAAHSYPVLKIKMGRTGDIEQLRAIRQMTSKPIRVDANCGWTLQEAIEKTDALAELGVELVEQPLPPCNIEQMRQLHKHCRIPLIADESCLMNADIPELVGQFDGINIKLMKCGGLREARRMIQTARAHELSIMIGCMIESSLANTAAAHLTPLADYADLDGHVLITDDPYRGLKLLEGKIVLPEKPGIGVEPTEIQNS